MASFGSISAAGKSLERLLNAAFTEPGLQPVPGRTTRAVLARTEDFEKGNLATSLPFPALSIFLYRVDFNKTMRAAWAGVGHQEGRAMLPVDLHFLITPWADNAEFELRILGRAMQALETTPIVGGAYLTGTGEFASNEGIQVVLEDISTEEVMRTFDSLPTDYKLSVPYVARVIRIHGSEVFPSPPVTTLVTGRRPSVEPP